MRTAGLVCCLVAALAVAGCETQQEIVSQKEDLLAAAGFQARPANTPDRQAMLAKLPANHFAMRDVNGKTVYLYGDPIACRCVYFGDSAAFSKYKQERFQQRIADEQQTTADLYSDPGWGWGAWGPGWWGGGFGPGFGPYWR